MNNKHRPMRSVWQSLLWKEWHEHKWKLASLTAILLAFPLVCLVIDDATLHEVLGGALFMYVALAGLFISMGIAAGENSRGTMPFLQALPVPMWKPALSKISCAATTVVVPMLLVAGFTYGLVLVSDWIGVASEQFIGTGHNYPDWAIGNAWAVVLAVLSVLIWGAAAGVNRCDEVRAGAIAILTILCWFQLVSWTAPQSGAPSSVGFAAMLTAGPTVGAFLHDDINRILDKSPLSTFYYMLIVLAGVLSHSSLLGWYLLRFGKPGFSFPHIRPQQSDEKSLATWLAPPRRSKLSAIVWKQARETGPFALLGFAGIVGLSLIFASQSSGMAEFEHFLLAISGFMGFFLVVIAGIGVFNEDLKPKLDTFWRSRPVNLHLWFWAKFLTGLTIISVSLATPALYAYWQMSEIRKIGHLDPIDPIDFGMIVMLFVTLYCWAVAAICLVRQPLYAAVLTIASVMILPLAGHLFNTWRIYQGWSEEVLLMILCAFLSTLAVAVAWISVRFDLGCKG